METEEEDKVVIEGDVKAVTGEEVVIVEDVKVEEEMMTMKRAI